jgi:hypothetical protein
VSSKSKASRGNSRCGRIRLEVGSLSGQPGGDAISSVSRSSHHAGNRAVMRFRGGDSGPVVLGATRGGRSSESPSRPVERATVRRRFGRSREGSPFGYPDGGSNRRDSRPSHRLGNQRVIGFRSGERASRGQPGGERSRDRDRVSGWVTVSRQGFVRRRCGRKARKLEQAGGAVTYPPGFSRSIR